MTVRRPLLRWHGGKWMLAPWIVGHFPQHRIYVEPFGGAGSVLLRKPRAYAEVWNDLDAEVVNLFRVLRSPRAAELVDAVRLTPWSRDEFYAAYQPADDAVERARRLIVRAFLGHGSNSHAQASGFRGAGFDAGRPPARDWQNFPDSLAAVIDRLSGVVVENKDAMTLLAQHDRADALFYVDPPYLPGTRDAGSDYAHEMTVDDHAALLDALCGMGGMVVLSGYSHALYDGRLAAWRRVTCDAFADGGRPRTECLWLNPACAAALDADIEDSPLFGGLAAPHSRLAGSNGFRNGG